MIIIVRQHSENASKSSIWSADRSSQDQFSWIHENHHFWKTWSAHNFPPCVWIFMILCMRRDISYTYVTFLFSFKSYRTVKRNHHMKHHLFHICSGWSGRPGLLRQYSSRSQTIRQLALRGTMITIVRQHTKFAYESSIWSAEISSQGHFSWTHENSSFPIYFKQL